MTSNQASRVPHIPLELVDRIMRLLDKQTLSSCSVVHSSWLPFARPLLWNTVELDSHKVKLRKRALSVFEPDFKPFADLLRRSRVLARNVRTLVVQGMKVHKYKHSRLQPLYQPKLVRPVVFSMPGLLSIMRSLPELRELRLLDVNFRYPRENTGSVTANGARTLSFVPLVRLQVSYRHRKGPDAEDLARLLSFFDPLALELTSDHDTPSWDPFTLVPFVQLHNRRITSIHVASSDSCTMSLLKSIPEAPFAHNIQLLDLRVTYPEEVLLLAFVLNVAGPSIRGLRLRAQSGVDSAQAEQSDGKHVLSLLREISTDPDRTVLSTLKLVPCVKLERLETSVVSDAFYSGGLVKNLTPESVVPFLRTVRAPLREVVLKLYLSSDGSDTSWRPLQQHFTLLDEVLGSFKESLQTVTLILFRPTPSEARSVMGVAVQDLLASYLPRIRGVLRIDVPHADP